MRIPLEKQFLFHFVIVKEGTLLNLLIWVNTLFCDNTEYKLLFSMKGWRDGSAVISTLAEEPSLVPRNHKCLLKI